MTRIPTRSVAAFATRSLSLHGVRAYFPALMFVVLVATFSLLSDKFLTFNNTMIILQQAVPLLVVGLGMTFVIIGGSIDLSVGSIVALAALASAAASGS